MHVFDRRQLDQIRGVDPDLERRFLQLLGDRPELPATGAFRPPADVLVGPGEVVVVMELAGIRREDIRLATGEDELVVQGCRREPVELEREEVLALEIATGEFERRVALPLGLRLEQVSAAYRDGFLVVRIPRGGGPASGNGEETN
ncbi:MAG: Hsp20/alpha crystallin family protein [bacterium]|jgi:HSP20 family protein|nr:Hsp20/alpha crystallin family protein [bacterium]